MRIHASLLSAGFLVLVWATVTAIADNSGSKDQASRLDGFEKELRELRSRVDSLENRLKAAPALQPIVPAGVAAWRELRKGMTEADVRRLLGEPKRIITLTTTTQWLYEPSGSVDFTTSARVNGWMEPY